MLLASNEQTFAVVVTGRPFVRCFASILSLEQLSECRASLHLVAVLICISSCLPPATDLCSLAERSAPLSFSLVVPVLHAFAIKGLEVEQFGVHAAVWRIIIEIGAVVEAMDLRCS